METATRRILQVDFLENEASYGETLFRIFHAFFRGESPRVEFSPGNRRASRVIIRENRGEKEGRAR